MDLTTLRLSMGATKGFGPDGPPDLISFSTSGNTNVINRPATYMPGDLFYWVINLSYYNWNTTVPSGWTLVSSLNYASNRRIRVFQKVATGAEPASYTGPNANHHFIGALRGPWPNWAIGPANTGSQQNTGSIVTAESNTTTILSCGNGSGPSANTPPNTFTNYTTVSRYPGGSTTFFDENGNPIISPYHQGIYIRRLVDPGTHSNNNSAANNQIWSRTMFRKTK